METPNIHLNNKLDKEVQQMVLPLNLMQALVLNPKYHIKNKFIHPNNCLNNSILISGAVIFLATYIYRIVETKYYDDNFKRYSSTDFLMFASFFDFGYRCLGFIINFVINFSQTKNHVVFVLTFQDVHRFLHNKASVKRFVLRSWMSIAAIFGFYTFMLIYIHIAFFRPPLNVMFYVLIMVSLDTNLIYAMRLMKLLTDKVVLWNIRLLLIQKNRCSKEETTRIIQAYEQILKCYKIVIHIYQIRVLYSTLEAFCHNLVHVQQLIETFKSKFNYEEHPYPFSSLFLSFWIIKNLVIHISLSMQFEAFYEAVKFVRYSCEFILGTNSTDNQKKLCKNVLRVHRTSFSKMSVLGLFYIDNCHLLRVMALLTHYTVVLLQFAFLQS